MSDEEDAVGTLASKLDFALATGAASTLFDHEAGGKGARFFGPAALSRMLVTFQCFSPGGTIGVAFWHNQETLGKGHSSHAPCSPSAMLHSFVRKGTLLETLVANLVTKRMVEKSYGKAWGRPVWEEMPRSFSDETAIQNATQTFLGRLMPLSRAVLMRPNGRSILLANGLTYPTPPEFPAEPSASLVRKKDNSGHALVGASVSRAMWRELPALVSKRIAADGTGGPLALSDIANDAALDLWVGALITDKASILDTVEGVYSIPARMMHDAGRLAYQDEVQQAVVVSGILREACKTYRQGLETSPQGYPEQTAALRFYWTSVEQLLPRLNTYVAMPDEDEAASIALGHWRDSLWRAARKAFELACSLDTPRKQRAHALALRVLQVGIKKASQTIPPVPSQP